MGATTVMTAAKAPRMRVRDVFDIDRSLALVVPPDEPFESVVRRFATRADLRGIFVADRGGRLVGVITRQDLLFWAAEKLGEYESAAAAPWHDLYRLMNAATAKDACRPHSDSCSVRPDDPLRDAFRLMLENELIDIPVVEKDGRIIGDIRLSELLAKVLEREGG